VQTASPYSTVTVNQGKSSSSDPKRKKDYSTAILERKKSPNQLEVDEVTNDDNSVVALHPDAMELFHGTQILSRLRRGPTRTRPMARLRSTARPRPPRSRGTSFALLEAPRRGLERGAQSPSRPRVGDLPSESRLTPLHSRPPRPSPPRGLGSGGKLRLARGHPRQTEQATHLLTRPTDRGI